MNNDLISREALKADIDNLRLFKPWVREEIKAHIDNAPTVNIPNYGGQVVPDVLQGWKYEERPQVKIKVNITEEEKQRLIEELQKPHMPIILPESEFEITNEDIQQAIKEGFANGYEMAKAKFSPKQGVWLPLQAVGDYKCSKCGAENLYKYANEHERWIKTNSNFCPNCGASMKGGAE